MFLFLLLFSFSIMTTFLWLNINKWLAVVLQLSFTLALIVSYLLSSKWEMCLCDAPSRYCCSSKPHQPFVKSPQTSFMSQEPATDFRRPRSECFNNQLLHSYSFNALRPYLPSTGHKLQYTEGEHQWAKCISKAIHLKLCFVNYIQRNSKNR